MKRFTLIIVLSLIFLEWLDFSLYLYLAKSVFAVEFFPTSQYSLILTFALFAAAYLARPLGGWLFGREADLNGRRKPMVFAAALMGIATIGICLLPGYHQIGILAAWGLLGLRIAQGIALGGEINTSAMFLLEHHPNRPLVTGSLAAASGAAGMFTGGALAAFIQFINWPGFWRLIFAGVGCLSLWVCRRRKQLQESPEFKQISGVKMSLRQVCQVYGLGLLNIAAVGVYVSTSVYLCNVFWLSFVIDKHVWTAVQCAWIASFAQLASALLAIPIAWFAKPSSAKHLMGVSMVVMAMAGSVLFYFTTQKIVGGIVIGLIGYVIANGLICASLYYFLYLQLPSSIRCQGVSLVWALAASLGAILLPVTEQMVMSMQVNWLPEALIGGVALLALLIIQPQQAHHPIALEFKI